MQHRTVTGRIRYISRKPESFGHTRGIEYFRKTIHSDGSVTMRSTSELEIPEPKLLRDVIQSYGPGGEVTDVHLRVMLSDKLIGTAWYWNDGVFLNMEAWGPTIGRTYQRMPFPAEIEGLATHPIVSDGYLLKAIDRSRGPHRRKLSLYVVSPDHRGATPPSISPVDIWVQYVGDETIAVSAGTFDTHHFRFTEEENSGRPNAHPDTDVWVTRDEFIYCKGEIGGYFMSEYELEQQEIIDGEN